MGDGDWADPGARAVAIRTPVAVLLVNAWWEPLTFRLPAGDFTVRLDTAEVAGGNGAAPRPMAGAIEVGARAIMLLAGGSAMPSLREESR